ncbi:MAG: emp24/gp25L/p24 family/GOLD-domain-containing protein [Monoraphidium minutum]|nr:MAG: emp24/gp25L/p24 family/GOLD-domain-containing protein [Monoraphidium minutum]
MARAARGRAPHAALLLALATALVAPGGALKVMVHPAATECFTEPVEQEHFAVQGGPRIEGAFFLTSRQPHVSPSVTVLLYGPTGELLWSQAHADAEAHFNVAARGAGAYRVCFQSHTGVDITVDLVYFSLGHLRRPGQLNVPKGTEHTRGKEFASKDNLDEVKRDVLVVGELVEILSGEQRYLQRKLERHMQTCRSSRRRTLWYTILEVLTLAAIGAFNVHTVFNMFSRGGRLGPGGVGRIVV